MQVGDARGKIGQFHPGEFGIALVGEAMCAGQSWPSRSSVRSNSESRILPVCIAPSLQAPLRLPVSSTAHLPSGDPSTFSRSVCSFPLVTSIAWPPHWFATLTLRLRPRQTALLPRPAARSAPSSTYTGSNTNSGQSGISQQRIRGRSADKRPDGGHGHLTRPLTRPSGRAACPTTYHRTTKSSRPRAVRLSIAWPSLRPS